MPTGQAFAAFNLKQLVGFQDIGVRGMAALRANHVEATQARWDVDGVFNTKLTLSAPGASQVQVNGTSKATDGLGHVLNISAAYKNVAQFQNTNAIVYHVGFMYAELPSGLRINPRTGKPQFDRYTEEVGFAAAPTSVTDNGNGTITFNVNSVTESGVSNAGRLVRVYKVVPADGALNFAMALEECTVTFGANNSITTVGKFGQTTVSTTAGDYIVVCMGPRVARNTDLSTVSGVVYVGTVTGNGGTPVTFSNTNQTLLKTFTDASQVTYTPAGWLAPGATNVQLALDALVNGLQASTPSGVLSGAQRVGVYAPDYAAVSGGGIGNVADSTFTTSATVRDLGMAVDRAIKRRFAYWVKNDGTFSDADDSTGTSITNSMTGRPMWVRTLNNAATTPYTWGSDTSATALSNYMVGEFADITQANPHLRFTRLNQASGVRAVSGTKWERLWLDATAGASYRFGGTAQRSGLIAQLCGFNGGALLIEPCAATSNVDWGFNFRCGVVIPKDEATKAYNASCRFGLSTGAFIWSVWENMLAYGPSASQTTPAGAGYVINIDNTVTAPINAATVAAQSRPFVFRDCVFIMQRATDTTVCAVFGNAPVVFENCRFFGFAGHASGSAFLAAAGACVTMRDCIVFDPEGMCVDMSPTNGISGLVENCIFVAGIGGSSSITAPFAAWFNGNVFGLAVTNCTILLGAVCFRSNATATTTPLVRIGNNGAAIGNTVIRNLVVKVEGGTDLGWARLVEGTTGAINGPGTHIDGLIINCNNLKPNLTQTNVSIVKFSGVQGTRMVVDGLWFGNVATDATTPVTTYYVEVGSYVSGRGWAIAAPNTGNANGTFGGMILWPGSDSNVQDLILNNAQQICCTNGVIAMTGSRNVIDGFRTDLAVINKANAGEFCYINNGNDNIFTHFNVSHLAAAQGGGTFPGRVIIITGTSRDNAVRNSRLSSTHVNNGGVVFFDSTGRRQQLTDCVIHYNGTGGPALQSTSPDALADSLTCYRSAGATAAITNSGAGAVTGSVITSTTL